MRSTILGAVPRNGLVVAIGLLAFALLTPAVIAAGEPLGAAAEPDAVGNELVVNGGFESGSDPWRFTEGAGRATNYPHSGQGLAYLDASTEYEVAQTLTVEAGGDYTTSAWMATAGAGGVLGLRDLDTRDVLASRTLPVEGSYRLYSLDPVALSTGQHVEVFVSGSSESWVNIDDVSVLEEPKGIVITSSNDELVETFNWARWRARQHVQTGKTGPIDVEGPVPPDAEQAAYIPSYWAGYAHRTAFYIRDYAHQSSGAHLLGLAEENRSMLQAYAATSTESRSWYPLWALNFDGSSYFVDHPSEDYFVREVPAVFELVHKAAEQYRWTGDATYLEDPALWEFYTNAVTEFVELHDTALPNGVAEGTGRGIWYGAASYNERSDHEMIEAGDGIAAQYQAFRGYADLARARGDAAVAEQFDTRADDLFEYFNTDWGVVLGTEEYARGRMPDGAKVTGWGQENSMFMAYDKIIDPNSRKAQDFVDYMYRMYTANPPSNIESSSYVPDALFAYGRSEEAWAWMRDTIISALDEPHEVVQQGTNGDYPEIPFTLVSQTVEGLAGVVPDAPSHAVSTLSRLPEDIGWLGLDHITVGEHDLGVRHDGGTRTTVTHNDGPEPLETTISFYGGYAKIEVDGRRVKADHSLQGGKSVSSVTVSVPPGEQVTAEAVGRDDQERWGDALTTHPDDFELGTPADDAVGVSPRNAELRWSRSDNANEYRVTVATDPELTDVVRTWTVRGTTARAPRLEPGRTYYWAVTAVNTRTGQQLPVPGGPHTFRTMPTAVPAAPINPGAYRTGDRVALTWENAPFALTATVERAPVGSTDFEVVAESVETEGWVDRDAGAGPWSYRVSLVNERGAGDPALVEEQPMPADLAATALSDRDWESATIGWGSLGRDRSVSGEPISLFGTEYEKGIGTHANSEIVYRLDPGDVRFNAVVGIDDFQRNSPYSSVVFQVEADGELVYESPVLRGDSAPVPVELDVLGVDRLVLRVTDAGDGNNSDHADWADATVHHLP